MSRSIDLCVVNYNTKDKLERFLNVLHSDGRDGWDLFIADNGSTDGSAEWLIETYNEGLKYKICGIFPQENVGYARACNKLASYGVGDIVGLLNADVWLSTSDVAAIHKAFDDNSECAILGPKQRDERGSVTHAGIFGDWQHPKHRGWRLLDPRDEYFRDIQEAVTVSGSAYFVRRSVWDEMTNCPVYKEFCPESEGAFLPTPHYYEETFLSGHAHYHGYKVFYNGEISIGHSWHASSDVGSEHDRSVFPRSREYYRAACDYHGIPHD